MRYFFVVMAFCLYSSTSMADVEGEYVRIEGVTCDRVQEIIGLPSTPQFAIRSDDTGALIGENFVKGIAPFKAWLSVDGGELFTLRRVGRSSDDYIEYHDTYSVGRGYLQMISREGYLVKPILSELSVMGKSSPGKAKPLGPKGNPSMPVAMQCLIKKTWASLR